MILSIVGLLAGAALAQSTGDTATTPPGDTSSQDTGAATTTWDPTVTWGGFDSGLGSCADCATAAQIAGEQGGSPCQGGCDSGAGGAALLALWLVPLLYRRSYST